MSAERIVLSERGARGRLAVVLEAEVLRVEGGDWTQRRRVPYVRIWGIERAGAWLWIGAGPLPLGVGGRAARCEQLARLEAALRARIAALPDGAWRLARLDQRRTSGLRFPWLTLLLALACLCALLAAEPSRRFASAALLLLTLGLGAEPWLGTLRTLASGGAAVLVALAVSREPLGLATAASAAALGWGGALAFARLCRERVLGVRARSALDTGVPLALALAAHALASAPGPAALLLAALAGFAVAPLLLRAGPEGSARRVE